MNRTSGVMSSKDGLVRSSPGRDGMMRTEGNAQTKGMPMKTFVATVLVICLFGVLGGCHSGIMRGAGADVERLGERMQR